ncbi:OmpP1/FadL family transporter [Gilvibacter sp.]|uniref:OmpP1/FadL family transporter n=1 Tax=Gilvibacter sp. TaxID=2729997 RepID=UPI003F4A5EF2
MRKLLYLLILGGLMPNLNAQGLSDALRYSQESVYGTARFNAMSGAFGALGGDLSGVALNPAGSAIFLYNYASATGALIDRQNDILYSNTFNQSSDIDAAISQAGAVWVFGNSSDEADWGKFTLAVNYELQNNFDNEVVSVGTNNVGIDQFFLNQANGIPLELLQLQGSETIPELYRFLGETEGSAAQTAFLGFQSFIIDPTENVPGNTTYFSNTGQGSFNQEHFKVERGYQGKYTFNMATAYKDRLYLGVNLNAHAIDYRSSTFLFESNNNAGATIDQIGFEENLWVLGNGFSAQIGAIAKVGDILRLGITYDTPTWLTLTEETTQFIETRRLLPDDSSIIEVVDPGIVNFFADYRMRTPGQVKASAALLFGQAGLISFDYGYKDYSNIEFTTNEPFFNMQNVLIANTFQASSSYRVGGEYRVNKWSFRGGYRFEESPFQDSNLMGDLTGYSVGLGYALDNVKIDLSYSTAQQERSEALYATGLTTPTNIDQQLDVYTLSLGFFF